MAHRITILITTLIILSACGGYDLGQAPLPDNYEDEFEEWQKQRMESLTNPTGWMRLAGMYWLDEGINSFGTADSVDIRFPAQTLPPYAGDLILNQGEVAMKTAEGIEITVDGEPADSAIVFNEDHAPPIEYGTLEWLIIEREDLIGIRLYNKENPQVDEFSGFDRYPLSSEWYLKARFIPSEEGATIPIVNVLGQLVDTPTPGSVEFSFDNETYRVDALEGTDQMFLIIGDLTNRTETYQGGRYIYIDYPDEGSHYTIIDFNKIYNPPCSYNLYTTCQLPPPQNRLDLAITAGEKRPVGWDGLEKP
jgi:uncharacterized protein